MKDNNKEQQLKEEIINIEATKNKYFLIGFILGCVPFILMVLLIKYFYQYELYSLIQMILIMALITSITNAFILKNRVYKRLIYYFNIKYDLNYYQIKKEFR